MQDHCVALDALPRDESVSPGTSSDHRINHPWQLACEQQIGALFRRYG